MKTYEEISVKNNLSPETSKRFIEYMRTRFTGEDVKCQVGYADEWAMRFKAGVEYNCSDSIGQEILDKMKGENK